MASDIAQALLHFLSGIRSTPSVEEVAYSIDGGQLNMWVLQSSEELEDAEQITCSSARCGRGSACFRSRFTWSP